MLLIVIISFNLILKYSPINLYSIGILIIIIFLACKLFYFLNYRLLSENEQYLPWLRQVLDDADLPLSPIGDPTRSVVETCILKVCFQLKNQISIDSIF